jgi:hypothetical protein
MPRLQREEINKVWWREIDGNMREEHLCSVNLIVSGDDLQTEVVTSILGWPPTIRGIAASASDLSDAPATTHGSSRLRADRPGLPVGPTGRGHRN